MTGCRYWGFQELGQKGPGFMSGVKAAGRGLSQGQGSRLGDLT